jgi:uncharacterized membrane protein YsdA (DUF1294 family)
MNEFIKENTYYVYIYLLVINLIGFLSMGIDKFKSKRNMWRIKEQTLFTIALIGGSIGSIIGMYVFRHKTKHNNFVYGMPVIAAIQLAVIIRYIIKYVF